MRKNLSPVLDVDVDKSRMCVSSSRVFFSVSRCDEPEEWMLTHSMMPIQTPTNRQT